MNASQRYCYIQSEPTVVVEEHRPLLTSHVRTAGTIHVFATYHPKFNSGIEGTMGRFLRDLFLFYRIPQLALPVCYWVTSCVGPSAPHLLVYFDSFFDNKQVRSTNSWRESAIFYFVALFACFVLFVFLHFLSFCIFAFFALFCVFIAGTQVMVLCVLAFFI